MQRIAGRHCRFVACVAVLCSGFVGAARADTVTVFAAASLREALSDIAAEYELETGHKVTLVFSASSTIARQVAQGAPADVALLADSDWANWLVAQGTLSEVSSFATNRLVLVAQSGTAMMDPSQIVANLNDRPLAMAQVDAVPAGRYGKAALISLGLWTDLEPYIVQADNVRTALRFVDRGEARFAVGYASDLFAFPALVEVYRFEEITHPPIVFSGGNITSQGADLFSFIIGEQGQAVLSDWGFSPPESSP